MCDKNISKGAIRRMPKYYRYVGELLDGGVKKISSSELSLRMNVSASQVRQDLGMFAGSGLQGYGYDVEHLYEGIGNAIGVNQRHNIIVVGAGNLGQALVSYSNFAKHGFVMKGMFDVNPRLVGLVLRGIEIQSLDNLEQFIKENNIQIAALTMPKKRAPEIAERLYNAGIKAIWNFANTDLNLPNDVIIENVYLSESLMQLSFRINASA